MPLQPGVRLGPYEITALIGAGGMGEVYKARDTRLNRTVAVKILPAHLKEDLSFRQRFEREAQAVAALEHPHICVLYDIGQHNSVNFLVMEYVEGETLGKRVENGPLPLEQVLRYAIEIAHALEKAHRQGIIHRDLKPANIMVTKSGVKLLDFGLAKSRPVQVAAGLSAAPTEAASLTGQGTILGTLQYMTPEQLEGEEADARTDIFAFGTIVYEMATGKKAFEGKSQASLISAILERVPQPISMLQPLAPLTLERVVNLCLAKDPDERFQSVHDVLLELRWISENDSAGGSTGRVPALSGSVGHRRIWSVATQVAVVTAVAVAGWLVGSGSHDSALPALTRFEILPPPGLQIPPSAGTPEFAVAPDGRSIAFIAVDTAGVRQIWVRPLDAISPRPLVGTEGAASPFWSPDSRTVGFFADQKLKIVDVDGGAPQTLCDASEGMGGTWSHDGVILFGRLGGPIHRVSRSGGTATPVTVLDQTRGETGHTFPSFLPDGRRFFYYVVSVGRDTRALRAASIDSKNVTLILPKVTRAEFVAPGFLVYSQANDLVAQPFNADELQVQGDPIRLAEQVRANPDRGGSPFSVSPTGILAYRTGTFLHDVTELVWLDGQGKELTRLSEAAEYLGPVLSPEGKRIAFARDDPIDTTHDIWLLDISRGTVSRFTFTDAANEDNPVWSPDGKQLAFRSDRGGTVKLSRRPAVGPDYDEVLLESPNPKSALSWSRDGQFLLYREQGAATRWDLWVLPLSGSPKPIPFAASPFNEASGQFSPNGRWIAYESDETGRREIYVQRFPPTADKWQVSTHGGRLPRWRPDGRGLFFVALDQKLMRVQLTPGPAFDAGVPRAVFDFHGFGESYTTYTPTPDGRFLINRISPAGGAQPLTVVLNWRAAIKK